MHALVRDLQPRGVVTGTDPLGLHDADARGATVADLTQPPLTISPHASLRDAADLLVELEVHRLVVVDPDDLGHRRRDGRAGLAVAPVRGRAHA